MAGFLNRLASSGAFGRLDPNDPLFGGLIPRREIMSPEMAQPIGRGMLGGVNQQPVVRQPAAPVPIGREALRSQTKPPMNVVYDPTMEMMDLEKKKLEAGKQAASFSQNLESQKHGLAANKEAFDQRLEESKFGEEKSKNKDTKEINERKQALDEWKAKNPDGQVEITKDGKIMVINKQTGKGMDTGLISDNLSEEEKLKLQHKNALELNAARGDQTRLTNATRPRPAISASQQRVASDDAAAELLRDPNYSWLNQPSGKNKTPLISRSEKGDIVIRRPSVDDGTPEQVENATKMLLRFEQDWKAKTDEILNKQFNSAPAPGMNVPNHNMVDKDGNPLNVPPDKIQMALDAGATMVAGAETNTPKTPEIVPMPEVRDDIELYYDSKGRIMGARNRKNVRPFKLEEQEE